MSDYDDVKIYSAIIAWLFDAYEHISAIGMESNASLVMKATQMIGNKVLDLCLSHAVEHRELIPRFRFTEPKERDSNELIVKLTQIADSETLTNFCPDAAGILQLVALDLLRAERIKSTVNEQYDIEAILEGLK